MSSVEHRALWRNDFANGILPSMYVNRPEYVAGSFFDQLIKYIQDGIEPTTVLFDHYVECRTLNRPCYRPDLEMLSEYALWVNNKVDNGYSC